MLLNDHRFFIYLIIMGCTMNIICSKSWDLAVTIGQEVHFFSYNGTLIGRLKNELAVTLTGIAYDNVSKYIFLGDTDNPDVAIFAKDMLQFNSSEMQIILKKRKESWKIADIVYDPFSQSLIWADINKKGIFKLLASSKAQNSEEIPTMIVNLTNEIPRGLSLDFCSKRMFWANNNKSSPSISGADFDGKNYNVIIRDKLYDPVSLTVDQINKKLYWIDDDEGIHYKIERSNLDGSNREVLIRGAHQQPFDIAVSDSHIYWTDWVYGAVWSIKKNVEKLNDEPRIWKSFRDLSKDADPTTLMVQDIVECISVEVDDDTMSVYNTIYSDKEYSSASITEIPLTCFNGGYIEVSNNTCQCKIGFFGRHCEKSLCHNYCLHGICKINTDGQPYCQCENKYDGLRCELDVCNNYCLNGGECTSQNGKPYCLCKYSGGDRCEIMDKNATEVCISFCQKSQSTLDSTEMSFCNCKELRYNKTIISFNTNDERTRILIIILFTIIGALLFIILILTYITIKYRKRPRVKKRFVVSKNGITPLTSRPSSTNECEIIIENCCNMNICETPCFEPALRSSNGKTLKNNEKNALLEDIDNNGC